MDFDSSELGSPLNTFHTSFGILCRRTSKYDDTCPLWWMTMISSALWGFGGPDVSTFQIFQTCKVWMTSSISAFPTLLDLTTALSPANSRMDLSRWFSLLDNSFFKLGPWLLHTREVSMTYKVKPRVASLDLKVIKDTGYFQTNLNCLTI